MYIKCICNYKHYIYWNVCIIHVHVHVCVVVGMLERGFLRIPSSPGKLFISQHLFSLIALYIMTANMASGVNAVILPILLLQREPSYYAFTPDIILAS